MDLYYDLKRKLCKELEEVARRQELSVGDLELVDKLTHSIKSLVTIMAMEDSGNSYNEGYSGVRRRDSMGRYTDNGNYDRYYDGNEYSSRRYYDDDYSGRRYSRDEGKTHMLRQFEKLMNDTNSSDEREILQSAINKLKNM